jgi:GNAT superfamily N-acetyltransferase
MTPSFSPQRVVCRPALQRDLEDIREFCRTIWNGHDYVPDVMENWIRDSEGIFAVAEYESHAIACSKVTLLVSGQWWLEGFRVDPEYQGLKVGSLMHGYVDEWWCSHGNGVLRLMTNSKNKAVHHLCEETGFTKSFEVRGYKAEPLPEQVEAFTTAASSVRDLKRTVEFALASPLLAITERVVDFGWRCLEPGYSALSELYPDASSVENHFFRWHGDKGLLVLWDDFDADKDQSTLGVGVLACELEDLSAFLMDVRHFAAEQQRTSVFWIAPVHEQVELALREAGYSTDWDYTAYVFEKKHPGNAEKNFT